MEENPRQKTSERQPCESTISAPSSAIDTMIGSSQYFRRTRM
jgi:hypothetical protein